MGTASASRASYFLDSSELTQPCLTVDITNASDSSGVTKRLRNNDFVSETASFEK